MFGWKNRISCLRRISVLVHCKELSLDDAIEQALYFRFEQEESFAFCHEPAAITANELQRLHRDAAAYIDQCRIYRETGVMPGGQLEINMSA